MAFYTETLAEWIGNGGELPAAFSLIDGFQDAFIGKYCDCEIGFETPALFGIKLNARANLVMQDYADRIAILKSYWQSALNPLKTRQSNASGTANYGQQHSSQTQLPFNGSAKPNATADVDAYENSTSSTDINRESGFTPDEMTRSIEFMQRDVKHIIADCLDEFKGCFMQIY